MGGLLVTPRRVDHIEPTYALVAEEGGVKVCYTSDTRDGDQVRRAADGSDFVLAEATMPPEFEKRSRHMSAREAGEMARVAGAGRSCSHTCGRRWIAVETAEIATRFVRRRRSHRRRDGYIRHRLNGGPCSAWPGGRDR
jgi:hypothetical protein